MSLAAPSEPSAVQLVGMASVMRPLGNRDGLAGSRKEQRMAEKKENPLINTVKEGGKTVGSAERAATGVGTGAIHGVRKVGEEAGDLARDGAMGTLDAVDDVG